MASPTIFPQDDVDEVDRPNKQQSTEDHTQITAESIDRVRYVVQVCVYSQLY